MCRCVFLYFLDRWTFGTAELLVRRGSNLRAIDHLGNTPLHYAAAALRDDIVKLFLDNYADVDPTNKCDQTPLHLAAQAGAKEAAELLIKNGADLRALDNQTRTPLEMAIEAGKVETMELIEQILFS